VNFTRQLRLHRRAACAELIAASGDNREEIHKKDKAHGTGKQSAEHLTQYVGKPV
jgi:hypothetical protein